ncbi:MaoC family dehydratase N-terminal domain-containing protein [Acidiphilium sp. AL]|nr:MaoC family dehydratase N-terminal domain-containing protein [Acidiphilium sp. AL]
MTEATELDVDALRGWIGRRETVRDMLTPRLVRELQATLDQDAAVPEDGAKAPLAIHWCLAPPAAPGSALGPDGHPARGGFLPPVPLPRRMWAGGALRFHDRLRVDDAVERRSRIADVSVKRGRSGTLCFVAVDHEIATARGIAIAERQDIVYRALEDGSAKPPAPAALPRAEFRREMRADPVLLFRYSALTFNGHRIHYDRSYVTEVENYPGLIVHGPLQATLLIEFAAATEGRAPAGFTFRGVSPLFDFTPFALCARRNETGLALWIETADGIRTMEAQATW